MAEVFGEFDAASPAPKAFCSRISIEQFERQSGTNTEIALQELLSYLEYNPTTYFDIVMKRKDEEKDEGFMAFFKSKMFAWIYGQEQVGEFDMKEAKKKLSGFRDDVIKSYNYAQEAKGSIRRFSHRLAERKWRRVGSEQEKNRKCDGTYNAVKECNRIEHKLANCIKTPCKDDVVFPIPPVSQQVNTSISIHNNAIPCAPPPPPLPPPLSSSLSSIKLGRTTHSKSPDSVTSDKRKETVGRNCGVALRTKDICGQRNLLKKTSKEKIKKGKFNSSENNFTSLMESISNPNTRAVLKPIQNINESFVTPAQFCKKRKACEQDSMFNEELIRKFKFAHGSPLIQSPMSDTGFTP